jgi:hypothetical protein
MIEDIITDDAEQAKIIFTDNKGAVLQEVEIPEKGKGQLECATLSRLYQVR